MGLNEDGAVTKSDEKRPESKLLGGQLREGGALPAGFFSDIGSGHVGVRAGVELGTSDNNEGKSTLIDLHKKLLDSIAAGIAHTDLSGRIIFANPWMHKIFGYEDEGLEGRAIFDLLPPGGEQDAMREHFEQMRSERFLPIPYEGYGLRKDGQFIDIEIHLDYRRHERGGLSGLTVVIKDVSGQRIAERAHRQSENRFKTLVSNIPGAVYRCLCDRDWTMKFASDAIKEVSGYPAGDFIDNKVRSYASIIHEADRNMVEEAIHEGVSMKSPYEIEYRIVDSCGKIRWVYEKGRGVFSGDGKLEYLDGIIFDDTRRKEAEFRQKLSENVLGCVSRNKLDFSVISNVLEMIKKQTGFENVGIRLGDGYGAAYYKNVAGLKTGCTRRSDNIYTCSDNEDVNSRCMMREFCEKVIQGIGDSSAVFSTAYGSFWSNSIGSLVRQVKGRDGVAGRILGVESVALVPLHGDNEILGVLTVSDSRGGVFTSEWMRFFERIGAKLGMALARIGAERELISLNAELEKRVAERTARLTISHKRMLQEVEERKALEKELLQISEREKRIVGQELHDSIGQQLAGIGLMAKVLERKLCEQRPDEAAGAAKIGQLVSAAIEQARDLARGLHPVDLSADTFQGAIKELAAITERLFGIRCVCKLDNELVIKDTTTAVHLYRICQEAITNAVKHGKTRNIKIELASRSKKALLQVDNDGEDFPEVMPKKSGMGLQIMDYRAEMVEGSLNVRKRRGGGTTVKCSFKNINMKG